MPRMVRSWNILPFGAFHFQDFYECYILVLIIDSLYTVADASKHLIRYCVDSIRQHCNWQFLAKENNLIALFAVDISNVNHRNIHADIAHILGFLAVDKAIAVAVAEMSVQSIGITYRNSSNTRVACQSSAAAVSYGLIGRNIALASAWHLYPRQRVCQDGHPYRYIVVGWILYCRQRTPTGFCYNKPRCYASF